MKKVNGIITKAIVTTVATNITLSSCYQGHDFEECLYGEFAENQSDVKGLSVLDVNESNLSDEFLSRIDIIREIMNEIFSDPEKARSFSDDPESYYNKKTKGSSLNLSKIEKTFLKAYSDPEIIDAVKNNNFEKFVQVCKEKDYIMLLDGESVKQELRSIMRTEEDYNNFIKSMAESNGSENDGDTNLVPVTVAVVLAAVHMYLVASAAVVAVAAGGLATVMYVVTETGVSGGESNKSFGNKTMHLKNNVLRIWSDNRKPDNNITSEIVTRQLDVVKRTLDTEYPDINSERVCSMLKIQLERYYEQ